MATVDIGCGTEIFCPFDVCRNIWQSRGFVTTLGAIWAGEKGFVIRAAEINSASHVDRPR